MSLNLFKKYLNNTSKKIPLYFLINGAFATFIHYLILFLVFDFFDFFSAGFSSLIASFFGSLISFFGNKFFVFQTSNNSISLQLAKFSSLYIIIALFHGFFLLIWTDRLELNYHAGFILAVTFQIFIGFF